jgi:YVTN family beta-propeller protein
VAVSPNGRTAYVVNSSSNDVSVISTATATITVNQGHPRSSSVVGLLGR